MDRTERFYKINQLLRANKGVSFAILLAGLDADGVLSTHIAPF